MTEAVLYRKWRPQRFADLVGQEPIVRTLKNAVAQGRTAHAYLFTGPRGTGKTSTGRILAKAVNCAAPVDDDPCGVCESCRAIETGRALDLIEVDAASNRGIDNIRDLRERANYVPSSARVKVYLIDEVHQLTDAAADALLKTLEEPPPHVLFILATTDPESLKATILSRCQRFDFRRVGVPDIRVRLRRIAQSEGIAIPDEVLDLIAREATGSLRDAVNLLDQVSAAYGSEVTLEEAVAALGLTTDTRALDVARAALRRDLRAGLQALAGAQADAVDLGRFNRQVVKYLRHALLLQSGATDQLALSEPETQALQALVQDVDPAATVAALRAFSSADLHSDPYAALPLELALAQLAFEADSIASAALTSAPVAPAPVAETVEPGRQAPPRPRSEPQRGRRAPPPREAPRPPPPVRAAPAPPSASVEAAAVAPAGAQAGGRDPSPEDETLRAIRLGLKERGQHQLAAFLNKSCRILSLEGDILTLGFFPVYLDIHKSKVEESVSTVAAAASAVIGRPISIVCTADDGAPPARSPLVAEAERMGARVVGKRTR